MRMLRKNLLCFLNCLVLAAKLSATCPCGEIREWAISDGHKISAEIVALIDGKVVLQNPTRELQIYPMKSLPAECQSQVLATIGWGRLWTDVTGKYHFAGDLVEAEGEVAILEDSAGFTRKVAISQLGTADRDHVLAFSKLTECCENCEGAKRDSASFSMLAAKTVEVCEVVSGDTLRLRHGGSEQLVQLYGIAAPDLDQDAGLESRDYLAKLLLGRDLSFRRFGFEPGKVAICQIHIEGRSADASTMMVQAGLAWHDYRQTDAPNLRSAQINAKTYEIKIWSQAAQVAPWVWIQLDKNQRDDFRRDLAAKTLEKAARKVAAAKLIEKKAAKGMGPVREVNNRTSLNRNYFQARQAWGSYWLNTESGARHNPSCRFYGNTRHGCYCGPQKGWACGHCGGLP